MNILWGVLPANYLRKPGADQIPVGYKYLPGSSSQFGQHYLVAFWRRVIDMPGTGVFLRISQVSLTVK